MRIIFFIIYYVLMERDGSVPSAFMGIAFCLFLFSVLYCSVVAILLLYGPYRNSMLECSLPAAVYCAVSTIHMCLSFLSTQIHYYPRYPLSVVPFSLLFSIYTIPLLSMLSTKRCTIYTIPLLSILSTKRWTNV